MAPRESRRPLLGRQIERARALAVGDEPMLADDRSALFEAIVDALQEDGRASEAKGVAMQWAAFLEEEAARAPDAEARRVFDAHRLDAYLAIGAPARAVPMLERSAREIPGDYNPPARLARAYLALKRYDDALAAIDHGLSLVYGLRALRLYSTKADILEAQGNRATAATALREALAKARSGPVSPRYAPLLVELELRARKLEDASPGR
jgi:tetratricopeptide (TPR) repeat protein